MRTVGQGAEEIRIRDEADAFRVLYVTKLGGAVYVLHCFQKKPQKRNIDLAANRYRELKKELAYERCTLCKRWDAIEDTPQDASDPALWWR